MTRKTTAPGKTIKTAAPKSTASAPRVHTPHAPSPEELQLGVYESAVALFAQRKFAEARDRFHKAAAGPSAPVADKARSYEQVCLRRATTFDLKLHTAEDHFNYGVERLNARDIDLAKRHLSRALELEPAGDHILYTLALCHGLDGDAAGACENLRRAIDLEPRNRSLARQDPEFSALAAQLPSLKDMLAGQR